MTQPGPNPDNYPPIDPTEPVPDDPGPLSPDTPETLPPAPVEPMPGPDDPDSVPVGQSARLPANLVSRQYSDDPVMLWPDLPDGHWLSGSQVGSSLVY